MGMVHIAKPVEACSALDSITVVDDEKNPGSSSSPIVVVKYGNCSPVTKIKYAQMAGAKMVIYIESVTKEALPDHEPIGKGQSKHFINS